MSDEAQDKQPKEARPEGDNSGWRVVDFSKLKNPPAAFAAGVYLVVTIIGGASLIAGLGAFFVLGYDMFFAEAKDRIEGAKVFFSVLVALIGGPVLIWRALTAHWAAQAARHQAETAREGHYTDLFTKAVEQLGATREVKTYQEVDDGVGAKQREAVTTTEPNLEVRLGAIYALDRVARDSERDHWPIMQVLCAYVRNPQNCGASILRPEDLGSGSKEVRVWVNSIASPRVDIQAAVTVLGERPDHRRKLEASRSLRLDLRGANLQRAALNNGNFERAIFEGAYLDGASFRKSRLDGASFGDAHLDRALFNDAHLDGASFSRAHLRTAMFYDAHLDHARFARANLNGAGFNRAHLSDVSFISSNLEDSKFHGAQLDYARFLWVRLGGATFAQAHLVSTSFNEAYLDGGSFFNVDLSKAHGINPAALALAFGDTSTQLPDGMERPATWPEHQLSEDEQREWIKKARAARPKDP